jgi:hypothetical protein
MSTSRTTTYIVAGTAAIAAAICGYAAVNANAGGGASSSATATPPSHTAAPGSGAAADNPGPGSCERALSARSRPERTAGRRPAGQPTSTRMRAHELLS